VGVAVDDTRLHKTGRRVRQAFFQRDPLSPPFHCNLMLGLRFLQASLLAPLQGRHRGSTRALPVRFQEASAVKRPKRNAPAEPWQQYRVVTKLHNLSRSFVTRMSQPRQALETAGGHLKTRLLVAAPTSCRPRKSGRLHDRRPAFLLTTVLEGLAGPLLRIYFDRRRIEVNHREEKDTLGVGQAQLRNPISVPQQPVLMVAACSALLLASLKAFGAARGPEYALLPGWRKHASRPSCLDLITLLRKEMAEAPDLAAQLALNPSYQSLISAAAARQYVETPDRGRRFRRPRRQSAT
jgi:hypothetical protein